jgi:single-strand DNA-binding protein
MGFVSHIVGNTTADAELRYTQSGLPVASFTVAVNDRKFNRQTNEWEDGEPTFVRCSAWRELAEHVAATLTKGTRVMVSGKVSMQEFEKKEGGTGASLEMQVDEIGPSLRYATAVVTRSAPKQQGAPQQGAPQGYGQQTPPGYGQQQPQQWQQPQQGAPGGWPAQQPQQGAPRQPDAWSQPGAYSDDQPF